MYLKPLLLKLRISTRAMLRIVRKVRLRRKFGRVFYTQVESIPEGEPVMIGMFPVAKHPTITLFDSGASHTFINRTFVVKHGINIGETKEPYHIQSPGG